MSKIFTEKNSHGETIHVKVEDGVVLVHHTDCSDEFLTMDELLIGYVLNAEELRIIYNGVKAVVHADTSTALLKAIKI